MGDHVSKGAAYIQTLNIANIHHLSHKDPYTIHVPTAIFVSYLQAQGSANKQCQATPPIPQPDQIKTCATVKNKEVQSKKPNNKNKKVQSKKPNNKKSVRKKQHEAHSTPAKSQSLRTNQP